ncbi:hypothetical protein Acr_27g0001650 [Actinidia rufa]|uniref:Uncharacterized protein n=1 Tax=Actinidia rufa TaxID=165716 RepID=A0A7J0H5Q0_9ERIC|nr:hypothetical protein Acr_27g0001650 [Actinidia rufa]
MSSDSESRQGSPELRPASVITTLPPPAEDEVPRTPPRENVDYKREECRTPTGPEHRIPPSLVCPPPPRRKRRRTAEPECGARKSHDVPEVFSESCWEDVFERMLPWRNIESKHKNSNSKRRFPCS